MREDGNLIMQNPNRIEALSSLLRGALSMALILCFITSGAVAQSLPPGPPAPNETIPAGSLIIAMDNDLQGAGGACNGDNFNLKAYGLAVRLLNEDIPLKWAINPAKAKDGADFGPVAVTQHASTPAAQNCTPGGNYTFFGGPLIITQEYVGLASSIINDFNSEHSLDNRVRLYSNTSSISVPVRYTLTHKPRVAIGPEAGGDLGDIHVNLFRNQAHLRDIVGAEDPNEAGDDVEYYFRITDESIFNSATCFTLVTQPHSENPAFVSNFKNFVNGGGNLLLQCESIDTFENSAPPPRFQSTNGYRLFGTIYGADVSVNTNELFPNPFMPYNQFIGGLANPVAYVSEFSLLAGSSFINDTQVAATNGAQNSDDPADLTNHTGKHIAAVSKQASVSGAGGHVFTLGGHDYGMRYPGFADQDRLNGQRMILNAVLVPSNRPGCAFDIPSVQAYKYVDLVTDADANGRLSIGDTVRWTINYINGGLAPSVGFQITDLLDTDLTYTALPTPISVTPAGTDTDASANLSYNGAGINDTLLPGAVLAPGGRITVRFNTTVNAAGIHLNHPFGNGSGINAPGIRSETVDNGTFGAFAGYQVNAGTSAATICQGPFVPNGCHNNFQTPNPTDPTGIRVLLAPTAADVSVSGRVVNANGRGIGKVTISITNLATGKVRSTLTNPFGYYLIDELDGAQVYTLSAYSKRHTFANPSVTFTLNDSISDFTFVAN